MSNLRFQVEELKSTIDALLVSNPELAEDDILRADTFEGFTDLHAVIDTLLDLVEESKMMAVAIGARKMELNMRQQRYERRQDTIRTLIQSLMERAGLNKLVLPEATLSVSFRKPAPLVVDESLLPDECVTIVRKPNTAAIKAWTDNTGSPPLGAVMSNGYSSLTIRTK